MTLAELHEALEYDECVYDEAQCAHFTALLENDLEALNRIQLQENRWKAAVRNKEVSFDFDLDRQITQRYAKWVRNAKVRLEQIRMQRDIGCDRDIIQEFERRVDDADETLQLRLRSEAVALARYQTLRQEE